MNIANIKIERIIAHEVVRASLINGQPPILSDELVSLDAKGRELIGRRLVDTIASGSHCVDVTVDNASAGSPFDHATRMLDSNDKDFINKSKHLASALSTAQTAGSIKSGSAIFVQGTCSADGSDSRFLAIIKADSDHALLKRVVGANIRLTYVDNMLLGESQRLIKIAFFIEESNDGAKDPRQTDEFSIKVFDHLMQLSGGGAAAAYFYSTFLNCRLADDASRNTKLFYETAREYMSQMQITSAEKVELQGDLISYLRSNRTTIEVRSFAQEVLPPEFQDAFILKCRDSGFSNAIAKDISLLKGKLRRQSVKFSSDVTLYASPNVFRDCVKITGETADGWTEVKIRGSIEPIS